MLGGAALDLSEIRVRISPVVIGILRVAPVRALDLGRQDLVRTTGDGVGTRIQVRVLPPARRDRVRIGLGQQSVRAL